LDIVDITGQDPYGIQTYTWYSYWGDEKKDTFTLVYDITSRSSFEVKSLCTRRTRIREMLQCPAAATAKCENSGELPEKGFFMYFPHVWEEPKRRWSTLA
jgi:hypothetical protein